MTDWEPYGEIIARIKKEWDESEKVIKLAASHSSCTSKAARALDFSFYQRGEAPTMVFRKGMGIVATKGGENENNGNLMGSFTITGAAELTIETVP